MAGTQIDRAAGLTGSNAIKTPVRVVSTVNVNLATFGLGVIDGVQLLANDRVLLTGQTDSTQNGIYVAQTGPWVRDLDFDGTGDIKSGTQVFVTSGTLNTGSTWYVSTADPITIGTTAIALTKSPGVIAQQIVDTIAALKALAAPTSAITCLVRGYYAVGDGGGGLFWWNAANVTADNGGTIIQLNAGGNGRWSRIYDSPLNVRWFGAKGDGATDDNTAVTNWLAAIAGIAGFASAGTYMVGSLVPPSNCLIQGAGNTATIFKSKAAVNAPVFALGAHTDITLKDFRIEGNSAGQGGGPGTASGLTVQNGTRIRCENIVINDCQDWGFAFFQGSDIRPIGCSVTNLVGGINANSVRGAYLIGDGSAITPCNDVVLTACTASGAGANLYYDGFMSEIGTDHRFIGCQSAVPFTNFKLKGDRAKAVGCYSSGGTVGFQTQTSSQSLTIDGCTAYRAQASGFQFNQADTVTPARNWNITGNHAIENGQDAGQSTRYGFAFEPSAGATIDHCTFTGNEAVDNQGVHTQQRGVSFGGTGSCTNFTLTGNSALGHANDYVASAILDHTTAVIGQNNFTTGDQAMWAAPAMGAYRLHFWINNVPAGASTSLSDGLSGRGYVMPRAGYVRTQYVRATAAVTAGQISFLPRKNGGGLSSNITMTTGTYAVVDEATKRQTFAAGDIITCIFSSTAGLLPAGTDNFDVVVEVVYSN